MQKSLEQEPQFAITANLAPQLFPSGVFIPQCIEVGLYLIDLQQEQQRLNGQGQLPSTAVVKSVVRHPLASIFTLLPEHALSQMRTAQRHTGSNTAELEPTIVVILHIADIARFDAVLLTRIEVFEQYHLEDYDAQITLPLKCHELTPLKGGQCYSVSYQLGSYPEFHFQRNPKK